MEAIGLGGPEHAGRRLTVLRAIDKLDRLGPAGVEALLGAGRKDESGDFTRGAGLAPEAIARVLGVHGRQGRRTPRRRSRNLSTRLRARRAAEEGVVNWPRSRPWSRPRGYEGRVEIDPSVVRGLEYYTGPVFEAELTFTVKGEDGQPIRFGSVGGGGRYDGLVARFRGEPVPATGFSIGVSRLVAALRAIGSPLLGASKPVGPVVVLVLDRDQLARYQGLVTRLREAGIRGRTLSRRVRHERAAQICRQAQQPSAR